MVVFLVTLLLYWNPLNKSISRNKELLWMVLLDHSSSIWELRVETEAINWKLKHGQTFSPGLLYCLLSVPCSGSSVIQPRPNCLWTLSPSVEETSHKNQPHYLTQTLQPATLMRTHPQMRLIQMTVGLNGWNVDSFTSLLTMSPCALLRCSFWPSLFLAFNIYQKSLLKITNRSVKEATLSQHYENLGRKL